MLKFPTLIVKVISLVLAITLLSANADETPSAQHRYRVTHRDYPRTFQYAPGDATPTDQPAVGYPAAGFRPTNSFDLPNEAQQPWNLNEAASGNVEQRRRPAARYGPPPPPPTQPRKPHDSYGPPKEAQDSNFAAGARQGDYKPDYFYADYEDEEFPQQHQQQQQQQPEQPRPVFAQSGSYVAAEQPQQAKAQDQLEEFHIPLELLRRPVHIMNA